MINKNGPAVDFPREEPVQAPVIPDTSHGFERERTTSRGLPGSTAGSVVDDRGPSRRGSEATEYQPSTVSSATKDKGKNRERNTSGLSVTDRSLPAHSRNTSTTSRIGETLTDVWGATKASTPSTSPHIDSKSSIYAAASPAAKAPTPKADTPKTLTPMEKARESRLGDVSEAPEHPPGTYGTRPPSQVETQSMSAAKSEPSPSFAFGSSLGNDNRGSSWNYEPAPNGGYVPEPQLAPVVEEPPSPFVDKKTKKKGSKLNSKSASVAPTPGVKTPKERSPGNDWANLNTTIPVTETVADPVMTVPVETADTHLAKDVGSEFSFPSTPNVEKEGGWGGYGSIGDSKKGEEEKKAEGWDNKPTAGGSSGIWDMLSPPSNTVSQGISDLSNVLGIGSSPRPSKPASPAQGILLNPPSSVMQQEDGVHDSSAPADKETEVEGAEEAVEEVKRKKKDTLTKAQMKKKKQQEEKEAKEKADREFQEQLEKDLAAEAEILVGGGDGGGDHGGDNVANGGEGWVDVSESAANNGGWDNANGGGEDAANYGDTWGGEDNRQDGQIPEGDAWDGRDNQQDGQKPEGNTWGGEDNQQDGQRPEGDTWSGGDNQQGGPKPEGDTWSGGDNQQDDQKPEGEGEGEGKKEEDKEEWGLPVKGKKKKKSKK